MEGNLLGTDATGAARPVGTFGVGSGVALFDGASGNVIGGTSLGAGNVISATLGFGVEIGDSASTGNLIEGNLIGTDATGTLAAGNEGDGVYLSSAGNTVGGTVAGAGNLIADNFGAGIVVTGDAATGNRISANRIYANSGQAIDLGGDGVTSNSAARRTGPNNLQNYPVVVTTADGQFEGELSGSMPNTTFGVDIFASSSYGPGGAGEAEDFLGSLDVTTDSNGEAIFAVPFPVPAGLPIVTATATDPAGDTSEVSGLRTAKLTAPTQTVHVVPGQPVEISTDSGDGIALHDPDAGVLEPAWNLTFSVTSGTLALSSTAGLIGTGDGTGSLSYTGSVSALDAALEGLHYIPPQEAHVFATANLVAQSYGAGTPGTTDAHRRRIRRLHDGGQRPGLVAAGHPRHRRRGR